MDEALTGEGISRNIPNFFPLRIASYNTIDNGRLASFCMNVFFSDRVYFDIF